MKLDLIFFNYRHKQVVKLNPKNLLIKNKEVEVKRASK